MKGYRKSRDGQNIGIMGISAVSIFVALLTVASLSAALFIDSVEEVKEEAIQTVEDALKEVTTHINVRSIYGTRENDESKLTHLYIHINLGPGCPPQNLSELLIFIDDGKNYAGLRYHDGPADSEHYNATVLMDPEEQYTGKKPRVHSGTTVKIWINVSATDLELKTGTNCNLEFTPRYGSTTIERFTMPSVFYKRIIHFW